MNNTPLLCLPNASAGHVLLLYGTKRTGRWHWYYIEKAHVFPDVFPLISSPREPQARNKDRWSMVFTQYSQRDSGLLKEASRTFVRHDREGRLLELTATDSCFTQSSGDFIALMYWGYERKFLVRGQNLKNTWKLWLLVNNRDVFWAILKMWL